MAHLHGLYGCETHICAEEGCPLLVELLIQIPGPATHYALTVRFSAWQQCCCLMVSADAAAAAADATAAHHAIPEIQLAQMSPTTSSISTGFPSRQIMKLLLASR